MADEVNMSLEDYWQEIIQACYLHDADPVASWKQFREKNHAARDWLQSLPIDTLHVQSEHIDLTLKLGEQRQWTGFSGHNIPSFEIFTSPDWRGTNGTIRFTEPLYRYGNLITDIELTFKDGLVVNATASQGEDVLKEMIATEGANKVGEFSLTDASFSRITKFMGETLFDENVGGEHGNTHIALGNSYHNCFDGDPAKNTEEDWERLGFNKSIVHTDIVSTAPRKVTATLQDGTQKVIYDKGHFCLD
jgi:aminopeptidase